MSAAPDNHQQFLQHLRDSEAARWRVARWLTNRGYAVQLQGMSEAPTHDQWKDHADVGDIQVTMRVEVKRLTCTFTSRENWPYGEDFIVCAAHSFNRAQPKPYAYVILNQAMTHAAFVMTTNWRKWRVEERQDRRYSDVSQRYYLAPIESVVFSALDGEDGNS